MVVRSNLTIRQVSIGDLDTYTCVAMNNGGTVGRSTILNQGEACDLVILIQTAELKEGQSSTSQLV